MFEFSTASYTAIIDGCPFDGYDRTIHVEEDSLIDLRVNRSNITRNIIGLFAYGVTSPTGVQNARIRYSNGVIDYQSGSYGGLSGWVANAGNATLEIDNATLTTQADFAADGSDFGTKASVTNAVLNYNGKKAPITDCTLKMVGCRIVGAVDQPTVEHFYNSTVTLDDCDISGTSGILYGGNTGSTVVFRNCISRGPILSGRLDGSARYEGYTPVVTARPPRSSGRNGASSFVGGRFNVLPDPNGLTGYGSGQTATGPRTFVLSNATVPSPLWESAKEMYAMVKFSNNGDFPFSEGALLDPAGYSNGFYWARLIKSASGWAIDGAATTFGDVQYLGTSSDGITWTATGVNSLLCEAMVVPRFLAYFA